MVIENVCQMMSFLLQESFYFVQKIKYALKHLTAGKSAHFGVIHKTSVLTASFLTKLLERAVLKRAHERINICYNVIHHLLEALRGDFTARACRCGTQ